MNCFKAANDVLNNAVQGISELITRPGHINVDFADVKTVMSNRGMAMMGIGRASGEGRAQKAVEMALSSPLLDDIELSGARGLLVNVTCDESLEMEEWEFINQRVNDIASDEADAKCGMAFNPDSNGEIWVTVVATGLGNPRQVENTHASQAAPAMNNPKVAPFLRRRWSQCRPNRSRVITIRRSRRCGPRVGVVRLSPSGWMTTSSIFRRSCGIRRTETGHPARRDHAARRVAVLLAPAITPRPHFRSRFGSEACSSYS